MSKGSMKKGEPVLKFNEDSVIMFCEQQPAAQKLIKTLRHPNHQIKEAFQF